MEELVEAAVEAGLTEGEMGVGGVEEPVKGRDGIGFGEDKGVGFGPRVAQVGGRAVGEIF